MTKYITYLRVSTKVQGYDGLGIDAQRSSVQSFVKDDIIINEYVEVESGARNDRPVLLKAIAEAKSTGSTLLIAKLDRLSRDAAFTLTLMNTSVDFICADMPSANTLTISIIAVMAQHERQLISDRTKAALQAKKLRGDKLGTPSNLTLAVQQKGRDTNQLKARSDIANIQATDIISDKQQLGWSLKQIADHLNGKGYKTRRGCAFTTCAVYRLSLAKA
jgi:DNA invertase Pin-like site-specific DNA recombinase